MEAKARPVGLDQSKLTRLLREGDAKGVLSLAALSGFTPEQTAQELAEYAVRLRKQDVHTLGGEAFVRSLPGGGGIQQVVQRVHLSVAAGDLFQVPVRVKVDRATGKEIVGRPAAGVRYDFVTKPADPGSAVVTAQGYQKLNGSAGVAHFLPPTVMVDGVARQNPYIERGPGLDGELGDVRRVFTSVVVIGPAPGTGNPVVVQYTLESNAQAALQSMAARLLREQAWTDDNGKSKPERCKLIQRKDVGALGAGWYFIPLYGGLGYAVLLSDRDVHAMFAEFGNLVDLLPRKAGTQALRNAYKRHPALGGYQKIKVNPQGEGSVLVVGWTGSGKTWTRWAGLGAIVATGGGIDAAVKAGLVVDMIEVVEDDQTAEPLPDGERVGDDDVPAEQATVRDPDADLRAELIGDAQALWGLASPAARAAVGGSIDDLLVLPAAALGPRVEALRGALVAAEEAERAAKQAAREAAAAEAEAARKVAEEAERAAIAAEMAALGVGGPVPELPDDDPGFYYDDEIAPAADRN